MSADAASARIAIDAMGGDNAPAAIVAGACEAARRLDCTIVLVGELRATEPLLERCGHPGNVECVAADETVAMDEAAMAAVRRGGATSMGKTIELVRDGSAGAAFSAGNSGAFMAIATVRLRPLAGIARPAFATVWPARKGPMLVLDAGANVDCRPEWIAQFGVMGSAYAKAVLDIPRPRVAIISVGEERVKGNAQTIEAARVLDSAPVTFVGNVEGKDVFANVADVIVTDGFVGNVMLKLSEGAAMTILEIVVHEIKRGNLATKLGAILMRPALRRVAARLNYENYGGAPLLGLRGNCIVAHGRASRHAIRSAIRAAVAEVREDVVGRIAELVSREPERVPQP
ncbi:MAG: phosphate acyltransferase PlsX [Candidatus Eremiobacteraeota bacterium]|nr:phosphate acyltransferase PlsX [Candidatus Eremiobacteraeota bacterium]